MKSQLIQQYRFCGVGFNYDPAPNQDQILNSLMGDVLLASSCRIVEIGENGEKEKVDFFIIAPEGFDFLGYEFDKDLLKTIELNGSRMSKDIFWFDFQRKVFITLNQEIPEKLILRLRNMKNR